MDKRSIAVISYHTCPIASSEGKETGGLNVYVLELSKALTSLGYTIDMYTRSQDPRQDKIKYVSPTARVIHLPAGPERPLPKHKLRRYLPQFTRNLMVFAQEHSLKYDLIHSHYYLSGLVGLALGARRGFKLPHFITFHTLGLMKNLIARSTAEQETRSRIGSEFKLVGAADHIVASSGADRQYLVSLYGANPKRVSVVFPGVNTALFRPLDKKLAKAKIGVTPSQLLILAVGRIEPLKGFDVLLYAIKILLSRHAELKHKLCLWIVGGDTSQKPHLWSHELKKLEAIRRLLKITAAVKFMGQQPQDRLPYYYTAADMVVMPSHYESFGMTALEAMACGTTVLATNVSGVSRVIEESQRGIVTSAHNPLLLADHMEHILLNPNFSLRERQKMQKVARDYSWDRAAHVLHQLYRRTIKTI